MAQTDATVQQVTGSPELPTVRRRGWMAFRRNRTALLGVVLIVLVALAAIAAPLLAPHDPLAQSAADRLATPSGEHLFGRDSFGRDILSRLLYGARISLLVGVVSVLTGGVVGSLIGIVAGYKGGRTEAMLMRTTDVLLAFPELITGLLVLAVLGPGLWKMVAAIAVTLVPRFARLAHGPTLSLRGREFVQSAEAAGCRDGRILRRHILPNVSGDLLVLGGLMVSLAIRVEANLSFLGLGVSPPTPTWGQMVREGMVYLQIAPWYSLAPGLGILVAVLGFNLVADGLRDVLDPRAQAGG